MKRLSIIIIAVLALLVCCKKTPEVNIKYVDVEREVLTIGQTTVNIQCDYEYISTLKSAKLYYGINETTSYVEMRVVQSSLYAELSGLNSGTTYKYYYEFTNGFNSMQSGVKTFTTEENPTTVVLPTVITADVTEITSESAVSGGEITDDGGGNVTSRGVCWSTSPNPTIEDSFSTDGNGVGSFVSNLTDLSDNTTYHVRAYATNEAGTAYGLDKEFTTLVYVPEGAINGLFTINENGDQVYFSKGNLQYQASTNTWRFAENQWDYVGEGNANISPTYDGWIDLFGWGTGDNPTKNSINNNDYGIFTDWGNNSISNGGNIVNTWRTLSHEEYYWIFSRLYRLTYARVNGINGMIILPDNWDYSIYHLNFINEGYNHFEDNVISLYDWSNIIEVAGGVFLPTSGERQLGNILNTNANGSYWANTILGTSDARYFGFNDGYFTPSYVGARSICLSVRLVQDANK